MSGPDRARAAAMQRIEAVELLRAAAAVMVVFGHLKGAAWTHQDELGQFPKLPFFGGAGVDLFFGISGFIIVHAGLRLINQGYAVRTFLLRRMARIVPLYWGVTALLILAPAVAHRTWPSVSAVVMSLAFVPYDRSGTGEFYPLCDLGWTLNYEAQFYVLFAMAMLAAGRRCVPVTIAMLGLLVVAGATIPFKSDVLYFWTRPIILEFAGGMIVALLRGADRLELGPVTRGALIASAIAWYLADPLDLVAQPVTPNDMARIVGWGVPGLLLLIAAVSGPFSPQSWFTQAAVLLGSSSFSLYLLHPFAIVACRRLLLHLVPPAGTGGWILIVVGLLTATAGSVIAYLAIEKPLTMWLTAKLSVRAPTRKEPAY
jgi:exopolysaccharide production protein ExoZ